MCSKRSSQRWSVDSQFFTRRLSQNVASSGPALRAEASNRDSGPGELHVNKPQFSRLDSATPFNTCQGSTTTVQKLIRGLNYYIPPPLVQQLRFRVTWGMFMVYWQLSNLTSFIVKPDGTDCRTIGLEPSICSCWIPRFLSATHSCRTRCCSCRTRRIRCFSCRTRYSRRTTRRPSACACNCKVSVRIEF